MGACARAGLWRHSAPKPAGSSSDTNEATLRSKLRNPGTFQGKANAPAFKCGGQKVQISITVSVLTFQLAKGPRPKRTKRSRRGCGVCVEGANVKAGTAGSGT